MNLSNQTLEPTRLKPGGGRGIFGGTVKVRPMRRYTLWSLVLHLVLFLVLSFTITPPQRPIFAEPIYSVAVIEGPVPNNAPPKPVPKQLEKPKPAPVEKKPEPKVEQKQDVVKVKEPEVVKPEPKKTDPPKKEEVKKPVVEPPKEKKPLKAPAKRPDKAALPPTKTNAAETPPEPVAVGMVDQKDFKHNYYLDRVRALIAQNWKAPASQAGLSEALVHFVIHRDGTFEAVEVRKSSGQGFYDRAAMRAVTSVSRFPPLPQSYSGSELGITVMFNTVRGGGE